MHIQKIDLNLFKVLDAIYSEGSITRAADRLNLTQPAVSHALARLRESFNDELFIRDGHQMTPSQLTRNIIDDVRESLNKLQVSIQHAKNFDPLTSQKSFTVSLRDILESTCLPPMMKVIESHASNLDITSVKLDREDMEAKLASGDIDLAIDVLLPVSKSVSHKFLTNDRLIVVARKDHPAIKKKLTLKSYLSQKHILVSSRAHGPGREDFELSRHGLYRKVGLRCQHYFSACRVVQETNMLLTMPEAYAKILNHSVDIRLDPLPVDIPVQDVYLYWHKNADKDGGNKWLRDILFSSI